MVEFMNTTNGGVFQNLSITSKNYQDFIFGYENKFIISEFALKAVLFFFKGNTRVLNLTCYNLRMYLELCLCKGNQDDVSSNTSSISASVSSAWASTSTICPSSSEHLPNTPRISLSSFWCISPHKMLCVDSKLLVNAF